MKKSITLLMSMVFVILLSAMCDAQSPTIWLGIQQDEIKSKPYIIEGTIVKQKFYSGRLGDEICSLMQITKIFRGSPQIKLGTIKIITNYYSPETADAGPNIGLGHCIIFGSLVNPHLPVDTFFATDNLLIAQTNDWITITGKRATWGWRRGSNYPTVDSLYSFFKANGLTVQEEETQQK